MASTDRLLGLDGPVVVVTANVALMLRGVLANARARARRDGRRLDPELDATLVALEVSARHYEGLLLERDASALPRSEGPAAEASVQRQRELSTADVAQVLQVTESRVRQLARARRLPGVRRGGPWWFRPADVADYLERRTPA